METESVRGLAVALAATLSALSITVYVTAFVTKGHQEPNWAIGIKTRATKSSKEAWVAGHRAAYPFMMAGATHCAVSAVLIAALLLIDPSPGTAVLVLSGALALGAAVILTVSGIKADREARKHAPTT
ncbi:MULTISPECIES: SdpI family protein [unclassified Rhodococcus (in: high G+C Gram-positive bacteria)]|uniref:SdpI family protein n=1 Tax=unclassified Rhodococcus (in: high G+C Gram-positive bacteria) TaxID=192944 RepID=UPI00339A8C12